MTSRYLYTYLLILFGCTIAAAKPLTNEDKSDPTEIQSKAGIGDILNPQNLPINPGLNLFNNSLLPNPLNLFKDVKLFFLTVQGAVVPANVFTGGLKNILQGLGNLGKLPGSPTL